MPSFADWKPYTHHVQGGMREGNFVSSQFAVICAGPPFLRNLSGAGGTAPENAKTGGRLPVYPIGIVQSMSIGQSKNISRFFEIGSDRAYFISGRSVGQMSLGRLMYHGPSLLRALYAYYDTTNNSTPGSFKIQSLMDLSAGQTPFGVPPFGPAPNLEATNPATSRKTLHSVKIPPGHGNFFVNLASDLFSQPLGLMFVLKDNEETTYGAFYLEQCYVPQHSMGFDSQGLIISEQVGIQYERMVPIEMGQLSLVRDVGGQGEGGFLKDDFGGYAGVGSTL